MLRAFGVLPTEERARRMKNRDYLWCALNLMLDEEEVLDQQCPTCRMHAVEDRCPVCGGLKSGGEGGQNAAFDEKRYEILSKGGRP